MKRRTPRTSPKVEKKERKMLATRSQPWLDFIPFSVSINIIVNLAKMMNMTQAGVELELAYCCIVVLYP